MRRLVLAMSALALAVPGSASAAERLQIASSDPAAGASIEQTAELVPWKVTLGAAASSDLVLEVATQNTLDPDGTLAAGVTSQSATLTADAETPTVYAGKAGGDGTWGDAPGTYYWQVHTADGASVSDVFTLEVKPLYLERIEYKIAARLTIAKRMGHKPKRLQFERFSRSGKTVMTSWASWFDRRYVYAGYLSVKVTSNGYLYKFKQGVRASLACVDRNGLKRCERSFRL